MSKEFRQFYHDQLLPELRELERERRQLAKKITMIGAGVMLPAVLIALMVMAEENAITAIIILPIFAASGMSMLARFMSRNFVSDFKQRIIERTVHYFDPELSYQSRNCISQGVFEDSKLFTTTPNRYKGDDLVRGRIGETAIEFSEIKAERESGSGKNRSVQKIFKGLFFTADFNKRIGAATVVVPDTAENIFGGLGQFLQSINLSRAELVKLEDPEFERLFAVYSDDQIQARYILSTSLMQRLIDFRKKHGMIHISFVGSMIHIAIPYDKDLFEPPLFSSLLNFGIVQQYYEDLQLAFDIVDDLDLNTRIWSK